MTLDDKDLTELRLSPEDLGDLMANAASDEYVQRGGNSSVRRATWSGREVAVKDYRSRDDFGTRAAREWRALTLLWKSGLRIAPEPLAQDCRNGIVVMEWIHGLKSSATPNIDEMIHLLSLLHQLAGRVPRSHAGDAADAIHQPQDLLCQSNDRLERLGSSPKVAEEAQNIKGLLDHAEQHTFALTEPVFTLSPSDFGPHNMLRTSSGLRLIDLEFFGWDDAHKLVTDTSLHPAFSLDSIEQRSFLRNTRNLYDLSSERLEDVRIAVLVKWCVIILGRADRESLKGNSEGCDRALMLARDYRSRAIASLTKS